MSKNPQSKVVIGFCPGCGSQIRFLKKVQMGEFFICDECGDELEVVNLSPVKLDWAFEDPLEEDYGDDRDFDFEDEYDRNWED